MAEENTELGIGTSTFEKTSSIISARLGLLGGRHDVPGTYDVTGSTAIYGSIDFAGSVTEHMQSLMVFAAADFHDKPITTSTLLLRDSIQSGNLMVTDEMEWSGGTISGNGTTTIAPGAQLLVGDVGEGLDGRNLEIELGASVIWYGWGDVVVNNGAEIYNRGTISANARPKVRHAIPRGRTRRVYNEGNFHVAAGDFSLEVNFHNSGTLYVESGIVAEGGGTHSGQFVAKENTGLHIGTSTFEETSSIVSAGWVYLGGGTMSGTYDVTGSTAIYGFIDFAGSVTENMQSLMLFAAADFHGNPITTGTLLLRDSITSGDLMVTEQMEWAGGMMSGGGRTTIARCATAGGRHRQGPRRAEPGNRTGRQRDLVRVGRLRRQQRRRNPQPGYVLG